LHIYTIEILTYLLSYTTSVCGRHLSLSQYSVYANKLITASLQLASDTQSLSADNQLIYSYNHSSDEFAIFLSQNKKSWLMVLCWMN